MTDTTQLSQDTQQVTDLLSKSNRILATVSSHKWPVDLFPSTLNVEESRITFIKRSLLSSQVNGVDIRNISNVEINSSLFFSQLIVFSKTYEENQAKIDSLFRDEAIKIRRLIEGLRVFNHHQVDTSQYSTPKLVDTLMQLSTTPIEM